MKSIEIYDTTLRDGAQTEGISYSVLDKLRIAEQLDALGVHVIEGGWPGSNPKDAEFFRKAKRLKLKTASLSAFGSTRRASMAGRDPNLRALLRACTGIIAIFGKTWSLHVREVLRVSLDENLRMIEESIAYLKRRGRRVIYDAEHFFDGYKEDPEYALKTLDAARAGGADTIVFCDTNGGSLPKEISEIIGACERVVAVPMGIHAHNDGELAVANTIAAVRTGCQQVQGSINGYGERCGNANLASVIPLLQFKMGIPCLPPSKIKELTNTSRCIAEISNMVQLANQPFVGSSAFAHKGGVHVNAVMKVPRSYEHVEPHSVGNRRKILVSELSGRSSIVVKARGMSLDLSKETPKAKRLLKLLQRMEHEGYHFEAADGSLELLLKRQLKRFKPFFTLQGFRVSIETEGDNLVSEATVKLSVNGVSEHTAAEGDGPVNALDNAIRKALGQFYPRLAEMKLTDFKVRVLDEKAGTSAKVRVLMQSSDGSDSWGTVGVSENIIEASWQALGDSIEYKLLKDVSSAGEQDESRKTPRRRRR